MAEPFWLILVVWGDRYHDGYVNEIARTTLALSHRCERVILVTDRERPGVDRMVVQAPFPEEFRAPELFRGGYPAKLALFTCPGAPDDMACVYLDLDTVVMGDVGRIAADLRGPDEILMLKAGSMGFNALSRLRHRISGGRGFSTGNSSVLAFTAARGRALAAQYLAHHADPAQHGRKQMLVDDHFISWAAAGDLREVDPRLAVMFRREFLSRIPGFARLKGRLPWVRRRRDRLVAVTLNGMEYKPDALLALSEGDPIHDRKGRTGRWSRTDMGQARDRIAEYCARILVGPPSPPRP
jgi:hypothetical protein